VAYLSEIVVGVLCSVLPLEIFFFNENVNTLLDDLNLGLESEK